MTLMRCLRETLKHQPEKDGVASKGGVAISFRDSKLTHMFKNHLTGPAASRTCLIVNVNPAADDFDETQHSFKCADAARRVEISVADHNFKRGFLASEHAPAKSKKIKLSYELELEHLRLENLKLKKQLKVYEGRIDSLTNQIALLQGNNFELFERVHQCEDHKIEKKELAATAPSDQNLFPPSDFENSSETIVASQQQPMPNHSFSLPQTLPNTTTRVVSSKASEELTCMHEYHEVEKEANTCEEGRIFATFQISSTKMKGHVWSRFFEPIEKTTNLVSSVHENVKFSIFYTENQKIIDETLLEMKMNPHDRKTKRRLGQAYSKKLKEHQKREEEKKALQEIGSIGRGKM